MRAALFFLVLTLAAYLPQALSAPWQGTEGRRVQIAVEMLDSGDFVVPTLAGEPSLTKPPLYYWALAGSIAAFGNNRLAARAPSLIALWLMACAAYAALRPRFGRRPGAIAGAGILCSPTVLAHGSFAEIDPLFAVLTAVSLLWLSLGVAYGGRGRLVAAGLVGSLAIMTKGPAFLLFLAGAALVWARHRRLRGFWWFVLPLLPIPIAYGLALAGAGVETEALAVAGREVGSRFGWFDLSDLIAVPLYLLKVLAIAMPLVLWTLAEFRSSHEARLQPMEVQLRVCVAAGIGAALILVVFPVRSVRYLLPGVLLFVCAVAPAVAAFSWNRQRPRLGQLLVVRVLGFAGAAALLALPWMPFPAPGRTVWFALGLSAAPLLVRTRSDIVAYALAVPLLFASTGLLDRHRLYEAGADSPTAPAALLRAEVERREAGADLRLFGHVPVPILLEAGIDVPGDEEARGDPGSRWVLTEVRDVGPQDLGRIEQRYAERVRIRMRGATLVMRERTGH